MSLYIYKKKHNNINQRYFNHINRIQDSYKLFIIFFATDGGWPPAANFTLVLLKYINTIDVDLRTYVNFEI